MDGKCSAALDGTREMTRRVITIGGMEIEFVPMDDPEWEDKALLASPAVPGDKGAVCVDFGKEKICARGVLIKNIGKGAKK